MSKNSYPVFPGHAPIQGTYNFSLEQVTKLCEMQDTLNSYIHPEWKSQGFNWMLAIQDEILEIHGHLGWKWWKGDYNVGLTAENLRQVQLEVIDILHFELSSWIEDYKPLTVHAYINKSYIADETLSRYLQYLQYEINGAGKYTLQAWADLARFVGLTEQMVMETYTQKYVLNKFRQDHGYKDGSYCKIWERYLTDEDGQIRVVGFEDNEYLADIVAGINLNEGQDVADETELYSRLEFWYTNRLNQ